MLQHAKSYLNTVETGNINIVLETGFIAHASVLDQVQYLTQGIGNTQICSLPPLFSGVSVT